MATGVEDIPPLKIPIDLGKNLRDFVYNMEISDYKRYDDEYDRKRSNRYRSRSRSTSRTPPERRKRSEQVNGLAKSRSRSPHAVPPAVEEKEATA
ncbi:4475_t:CDS:2 [Acaulospora colombiana]|uniref:4475_t:CDS:1 n=1 Tax=Acaulospora colombiana TaxID=27376 RepID=A0ACA9MQA8_9GLOM|nr:4475_t:CDS:2 [Acaulospora colombiana]